MAMALQATMLGWHAHGMIGFDPEATRKALGVPATHALDLCFAVGKLGPASSLPEALAAREVPSQRLSVEEIAFRDKMA
jgi:hypothetical protein